MGRLGMVVLATMIMGGLAGCGAASHPQTAGVATGAQGASSATGTAPLPSSLDAASAKPTSHAATDTPAQHPAAAAASGAAHTAITGDRLVVVAEFASGNQSMIPVTLMSSDGTRLGSASVPVATQWTISAGAGGAYWVAAGRLHRLGADAAVTDLGAVSTNVVGHIAISADGRAWAYATSADIGQGRVDNRLWLGGENTAPTLIASRIADPGHPASDAPASWYYDVRSWTPNGILVIRQPTGGCGCGPFDMEMTAAHSAFVDPSTGRATALTSDGACPLSGVGQDGLAVCFHTTASGGADELRVLRGASVAETYALSGTTVGGDARFDPEGSRLAYATVPAGTDCAAWGPQTTMRILDRATGTARAVGPRGLEPAGWLTDGRLISTLAQSSAKGGGGWTTSVVTVDAASGAVTPLLTGTPLRVVGLAA